MNIYQSVKHGLPKNYNDLLILQIAAHISHKTFFQILNNGLLWSMSIYSYLYVIKECLTRCNNWLAVWIQTIWVISVRKLFSYINCTNHIFYWYSYYKNSINLCGTYNRNIPRKKIYKQLGKCECLIIGEISLIFSK